ncbi:hypothetical protein FQN52_003090 [Onygenales sp. PD_12]|nr:hypothetical protein FQN52_003090 [Onygenales sp. PD_12]
MTAPAHTQEFEDAIRIKPLSSHTYSADLSTNWSVGTAPNGGYLAAIIYRTATTHFKQTHPTRHSFQPMPITMQLNYLRRSSVGPALLTVRDVKLGVRTSIIHVTLTQGKTPTSQAELDAGARVSGYVTISDPVSEAGVTAPSNWAVYPPPPDSKPPQLSADGHPVQGSLWKTSPPKHPDFRRASNNSKFYEPVDIRDAERKGITDQWARLCPHGEKGGPGKWTPEAVAYLLDIFPEALGRLENDTAQAMGVAPPYWFPTLMLNIDFKKQLPKSGVQWLYSRITMKSIRNGRTDIEVVMLDEQGEVVAIANQTGLIMSSNRNTGAKGSDNSKASSRL